MLVMGKLEGNGVECEYTFNGGDRFLFFFNTFLDFVFARIA